MKGGLNASTHTHCLLRSELRIKSCCLIDLAPGFFLDVVLLRFMTPFFCIPCASACLAALLPNEGHDTFMGDQL